MQQHFDVGTMIGKAILIVADILDAHERLRSGLAIDDRVTAVLLHVRSDARPSPAITILFVVTQRFAAQPGVGMAVIGDAELDVVREERARIASEIWSLTLSGWPSETDSLVKI